MIYRVKKTYIPGRDLSVACAKSNKIQKNQHVRGSGTLPEKYFSYRAVAQEVHTQARESGMTKAFEQKLVIYLPLALMCALAGLWLGSAAAIWSFAQIITVIEIVRWLTMPAALTDRSA